MKLNGNKLTISKNEWVELGKKFAKANKPNNAASKSNELEKLFGQASAVEKIKLAQLNSGFEDEGRDALELPDRTQYEAEQNYLKSDEYKTEPPYMLPEIADKMEKIVNVISKQITQEGVELLVEFKDKKLYTIVIAPYRK